jgi:putative ABC transport system substrate-binding protein
VAHSQQRERVRRIAYLFAGSVDDTHVVNIREALGRGLAEAGFVEGRNLAIAARYAGSAFARLPALAAELVSLDPEVIVAPTTPAALAAKGATSRIPIVFATVADPIGVGLVDSLARPAGNVTGTTTINADLIGKRLETLREIVPRLERVALLYNPHDASNIAVVPGYREAAAKLGLDLALYELRRGEAVEAVVARMAGAGIEAVNVAAGELTEAHYREIVAAAAHHRLPAIYNQPLFARAGGLASYSTSFVERSHRAASYVARILNGAKPADLPVEQPTRFELVINLKTAKALGLTIRESILVRADDVIE